MWENLQEVERRYERLNEDLGNPEIIGDQARLRPVASKTSRAA